MSDFKPGSPGLDDWLGDLDALLGESAALTHSASEQVRGTEAGTMLRHSRIKATREADERAQRTAARDAERATKNEQAKDDAVPTVPFPAVNPARAKL